MSCSKLCYGGKAREKYGVKYGGEVFFLMMVRRILLEEGH